jgi:hypothetical protein
MGWVGGGPAASLSVPDARMAVTMRAYGKRLPNGTLLLRDVTATTCLF